MSKRKYRKGPPIFSLDELVRQEIVFWINKPTHNGWFMSWQLRMTANAMRKGRSVYYAMPADITSRFADEEILWAERLLRTAPTIKGRSELIRQLNTMDKGTGGINDLIEQIMMDGFYRGGKNG